MNAKRWIAFLVFLISLNTHAQVQFAFFAGPQITSANYLVNDVKQPAQYKHGWMGGVAAKVEFDNQLYFFPSVYYSLKGYKVILNSPAFPPTEFASNNNTTIHTIEIAPLLHYDFNKKEQHFFIRLGPAVDFAVQGTEKFDTIGVSGIKANVKRSMVFSFTEYGRYTAQAIIHFGYETKNHLMVFAFYEYGFGSMNNADYGPKIFHRIAGVSLGWLFGRNPLVFDTRPIRK